MNKLLFAIVLLMFFHSTSACTCHSSSLSESYANADDVFIITVTTVTYNSETHQQQAEYDVPEILKGGTTGYGLLTSKPEFFIYGEDLQSRSSCSPDIIIAGASYAIFAEQGQLLQVDSCRQTVRMLDHGRLLELRKLQAK
tara:strand:+ start:570 stop:992 length:423 start_codon:yes stop_codon:yes gene_type:complete